MQLTALLSCESNFGIKKRWEIKAIQENANPGKYVG